MDRGEFQQDSVLKQLEVLKEEEKEFQNLKVRVTTGHWIWLRSLVFSPGSTSLISHKEKP